MTTLPLRPTLAGAFLEDGGRATRLARSVALVAAAVALLTLSAKFKVPFHPVPMSLQTLAVLAIGAAYGPRLGVIAVASYLALGAAGLPVFANTPPAVPGPAYFLGPTGGFLIGFLPAAWIMGLAARRGLDRSVPLLFVAAVLADAALFAIGFAWLAFGAQLASGATGIGIERAWAAGVAPFALGDLVKCALVAAAFPAVWGLIARLRRD